MRLNQASNKIHTSHVFDLPSPFLGLVSEFEASSPPFQACPESVFLGDRVDLRLFSQNDHHSHLRGAIRVNPVTLEPNDHHNHLRGSLRSQESPTLQQNTTGSLWESRFFPDCQTSKSSPKSHQSCPNRPIFSRVSSRVETAPVGSKVQSRNGFKSESRRPIWLGMTKEALGLTFGKVFHTPRPGQLTGLRPSGRKLVVATPSHACSSHIPEKVDTPKLRDLKARMRAPTRVHIRDVRTRMWTLVGARMLAFGSLGLGVSTFPWGRVTDTRARRSRHLSFYDP
ncbi:hypothetical protein CRG98_007785 [Punica granatum]|uniref:Uncharacterized protein n=1 Tax=Punica granatum TaxID=22663 RepID=A0A2I0KVH5_PUNGR|nr:hypothetical protein CRG98_007785 [Punica granatum]